MIFDDILIDIWSGFLNIIYIYILQSTIYTHQTHSIPNPMDSSGNASRLKLEASPVVRRCRCRFPLYAQVHRTVRYGTVRYGTPLKEKTKGKPPENGTVLKELEMETIPSCLDSMLNLGRV